MSTTQNFFAPGRLAVEWGLLARLSLRVHDSLRSKTLSRSNVSDHKERLLQAAVKIIAESGIERLTATKLANRVGLRRTVVHYHFGTMDELLAAIIRRSYARIRVDIQSRFHASTLGEDIWNQFTIAIPTAEAVRARALDSKVVGEAYREATENLSAVLADMLRDAYHEKGITPETPTDVMANALVMTAQFVGSSRALGSTAGIDGLEKFVKSLFAITARTGP